MLHVHHQHIYISVLLGLRLPLQLLPSTMTTDGLLLCFSLLLVLEKVEMEGGEDGEEDVDVDDLAGGVPATISGVLRLDEGALALVDDQPLTLPLLSLSLRSFRLLSSPLLE